MKKETIDNIFIITHLILLIPMGSFVIYATINLLYFAVVAPYCLILLTWAILTLIKEQS